METTLTRHQSLLAFALAKSHLGLLKNWIASAVERGDLSRAQELVFELREHEELFAKLNIKSREEIERAKA